VQTKPVLPASVAQTETSMLEGVLQYGTGRAAALGQFAAGKTGTTSNYGDAWFVGWDSKYTVAVWVGYPDKLVPMLTDFNGQPVMGGTFPALIWHDFMTAALGIDKERGEHSASKGKEGGESGTGEAEAGGAGSASGQQGAQGGGGTGSKGGSGSAGTPAQKPAPAGGGEAKEPAPAGEPAPPEKSPAPSGEGGSPTPPSSPPTTTPSGTGGVGPGG
jgi:penicillin-binding protein 1A